jgi:hypothetical protein
MQSSKKRLTAQIGQRGNTSSGASWHLAGRKTSSGRTYWEIISDENPRVEGRQAVVTKVEVQQQRSVMASGQQVGMIDQNGTAVCDTVVNEVSTEEIPEGYTCGYTTRCEEWDTVNEDVWAALLTACTGEPGAMMDSVPDKGGKVACDRFLRRWAVASVATIMSGLESALDYHPKGVSMAQHVTGWQDLMRKLKE